MTLAAASSLYGRYLEPIGSGFVAFLVLAAALAVPYVAWSYRRRGRVDPRQVWVAATFALFLLCAWALVLVPFPDRDTICSVRHVDAQLVPLRWVADTLREAGREGTGLAGLVSNGPFVVRVFNVALLLPLGVFLRRWWGASLGRTALVGLLLSLAFELTQWTGVWGIYPCAYRTFDVDDLMANTLGAVLGWLVAPAIVLVPRRAGAPAVPGLYPSLPRRLLAAALDYVLAARPGPGRGQPSCSGCCWSPSPRRRPVARHPVSGCSGSGSSRRACRPPGRRSSGSPSSGSPWCACSPPATPCRSGPVPRPGCSARGEPWCCGSCSSPS